MWPIANSPLFPSYTFAVRTTATLSAGGGIGSGRITRSASGRVARRKPAISRTARRAGITRPAGLDK
jgi:hypothetical protein